MEVRRTAAAVRQWLYTHKTMLDQARASDDKQRANDLINEIYGFKEGLKISFRDVLVDAWFENVGL